MLILTYWMNLRSESIIYVLALSVLSRGTPLCWTIIVVFPLTKPVSRARMRLAFISHTGDSVLHICHCRRVVRKRRNFCLLKWKSRLSRTTLTCLVILENDYTPPRLLLIDWLIDWLIYSLVPYLSDPETTSMYRTLFIVSIPHAVLFMYLGEIKFCSVLFCSVR